MISGFHADAVCCACGFPMQPVNSWVWICRSCGLEASSLKPGVGRDVDGLETLRKKNFLKIWSRLERLGDMHGKRLLEVGCAHGWFLEFARDYGVRAIGIEPADSDGAKAVKGITLLNGRFPEATSSFEDGAFDLLVFNDVFEHLPNPTGALAECARLLGNKGQLVINLPMNTGIMYRIAKMLRALGWPMPYERLWQKGYPSPHLFYYSEKSLVRMVGESIGFSLRQRWPIHTVVLEGLWARIRSGVDSPFKAVVVYAGCVLFAFTEKILPTDIKAFVFER